MGGDIELRAQASGRMVSDCVAQTRLQAFLELTRRMNDDARRLSQRRAFPRTSEVRQAESGAQALWLNEHDDVCVMRTAVCAADRP